MLLRGLVYDFSPLIKECVLIQNSYAVWDSIETRPSRLISRATKTKSWRPTSSLTSPTTMMPLQAVTSKPRFADVRGSNLMTIGLAYFRCPAYGAQALDRKGPCLSGSYCGNTLVCSRMVRNAHRRLF